MHLKTLSYLCRRVVLIASLLALVLCPLPCSAVTDAELDRVSRQEAAAQEARFGLNNDPALIARVGQVFNRIVSASRPTPHALTFKLLNSKSVNAFAYPNGMVYVDKGLLDVGVSDDELGFVLGHEVAHVTLQHARRKVENAAMSGFLLTILTGGRDQGTRLAGQLLQGLLQSGYSQEAESEADREGLEVVAKAGFQPAASLTFFVKLQKAARESGANFQIFRTHPLTSDRIRSAQAWLDRHPEYAKRPVTPGPGPTPLAPIRAPGGSGQGFPGFPRSSGPSPSPEPAEPGQTPSTPPSPQGGPSPVLPPKTSSESGFPRFPPPLQTRPLAQPSSSTSTLPSTTLRSAPGSLGPGMDGGLPDLSQGDLLPAVALPDVRGRKIALCDLAKGGESIVFFWNVRNPASALTLQLLAKGAGPCRVRVIAVHCSADPEETAQARRWVQKRTPSLRCLFDEGTAARVCAVPQVLPQALLVDVKTRVRGRALGCLRPEDASRLLLEGRSRPSALPWATGHLEQTRGFDTALSFVEVRAVQGPSGTWRLDDVEQGAVPGVAKVQAGHHLLQVTAGSRFGVTCTVVVPPGTRLVLVVPVP